MNEMSLKDRLAQYDKAALVELLAHHWGLFLIGTEWRELDLLQARAQWKAASARFDAAGAKERAAFDAYMAAAPGRKQALASVDYEKAKDAARRAFNAERRTWAAYTAATKEFSHEIREATDAAE